MRDGRDELAMIGRCRRQLRDEVGTGAPRREQVVLDARIVAADVYRRRPVATQLQSSSSANPSPSASGNVQPASRRNSKTARQRHVLVPSRVPGCGDGFRQSGVLVAAEALQPVATATTVRIRNGKASITDGPFAETKEQLAGFYLLEARDLNEAIQMASRIPPAREGSIEVRPVRAGCGWSRTSNQFPVTSSASGLPRWRTSARGCSAAVNPTSTIGALAWGRRWNLEPPPGVGLIA